MSKSEATIQAEILVEANKRGHRLWRSNAGKIKTQQNTFVQLFPKGFPALVGFRKSDGKFMVIEVKNTKGKLRPEQVKFAEFAMKQPIIYGVARSVDDAIKIIEEEY